MRVDRNALRFNQASIIVLLAVAFVLGADIGRWLVLAVAAVMLAGTFIPPAALFKVAYKHVVLRVGLLHPDLVADDPAPHQFAQGLGGLVLAFALVAFFAGAAVVGWAFVAAVVALAAVNLVFGFCLGCFVYHQLGRLGIAPLSPGA